MLIEKERRNPNKVGIDRCKYVFKTLFVTFLIQNEIQIRPTCLDIKAVLLIAKIEQYEIF